MVRQIVMPKSKRFMLELPDEMVGKTIEVLAFELKDQDDRTAELTHEDRLAQVRSIFADCQVDLSGFKFDREQANDYGE
ncbi:MAG: hypothetical protein RIG68_00295 [Imperialibacter sp.]|jgi:hypothetical protein|uniref:hypothetical protein n=1 Tax=Imperialibacter sp. TaxID=2038411 RepID=UPI0032ECA3EE